MNEQDKPAQDSIVCHVCNKRMARSIAHSAEGRDYTFFFCGIGCRQRWSADQRVDEDPSEGPQPR